MTTGWNRRRPTRMTLPAHAQCVRLIDSAADHTWSAQRIKQTAEHHKAEARKFLAMARACRDEVGPVLP